MDRQTDKQTYIRTFQHIERIGSEGRFFEKKKTQIFIELAHRADSVIKSRLSNRLSVNLQCQKTPTSGCCGDLWSKYVFLILAGEETVFKTRGVKFFFISKIVKNIGASIRIGREIQCLLYAGFFLSSSFFHFW